MTKRILIVDDDSMMLSFLSRILTEEGYSVETAGTGRTALDSLAQHDFDVVLTDLRMPDLSGLDVMKAARDIRPETKFVIITAYGSISNAVEAMRQGAADYLTKPLKNPEELRHVIGRVLREAESERKILLLSEELGKQFPPMDMIFIGEKMDRVRELVQNVAPTAATVLITGPTGTGKELVARVIHQASPRAQNPFVAVNCASLTDTLLESELFGHEKGAFTGAVAARKGRFEIADGGTIFLDEIGEISPAVQVKLLRVLQERAFERVGGNRAVSLDIRIVAATNKNLKEEVANGRFREDLFYRLHVFPITLPPLTERPSAIPPLARFFIQKFSRSLGKKPPVLDDNAERELAAYNWPGNIRELQNVIERALILASGRIGAEHLNLETGSSPFTDKGLLRASERELITKTLSETGGNRKKAAEILGISLRTLQYRIREYGL